MTRTSLAALLLALLPLSSVAACTEDSKLTLADAGADSTVTDTGPADTGPADTGPADTGPADTGPTDTGPADTGPADTGPADTGPADSGPPCDVPYGCSAYACASPAPAPFQTAAVPGTGPTSGSGAYVFAKGQIITGDGVGLPQGAAPRTLSLWVKTDGSGGGSQTLFNWGTFAGGQEFGLLTANGNAYIVGYFQDLGSSVGVSNNAWHHVAATYDGTNGALFVDGAEVARGPMALNTVGQTISIGQSIGVPDRENFVGSLSDIRVYDRVLTAAELASAASTAAGGNPEALRKSNAGLVYWLPLFTAAAPMNHRCAP